MQNAGREGEVRKISMKIDLFAHSATERQSGRPFRSFIDPPLFGPDSDSSISPDPINDSHGRRYRIIYSAYCIGPCELMLGSKFSSKSSSKTRSNTIHLGS
jgi:hypothetical protein